jgi:hypothetical protein
VNTQIIQDHFVWTLHKKLGEKGSISRQESWTTNFILEDGFVAGDFDQIFFKFIFKIIFFSRQIKIHDDFIGFWHTL